MHEADRAPTRPTEEATARSPPGRRQHKALRLANPAEWPRLRLRNHSAEAQVQSLPDELGSYRCTQPQRSWTRSSQPTQRRRERHSGDPTRAEGKMPDLLHARRQIPFPISPSASGKTPWDGWTTLVTTTAGHHSPVVSHHPPLNPSSASSAPCAVSAVSLAPCPDYLNYFLPRPPSTWPV
jgi:hypothetical protein